MSHYIKIRDAKNITEIISTKITAICITLIIDFSRNSLPVRYFLNLEKSKYKFK